MCRWLAYSGPPIYLEELIVKPSRSLLVQSRFARENYVWDIEGLPDGAFPTNGDGFGIGWYSDRSLPGVYRDLRPAWSDENLLNLAGHLRSHLFMAHLRAAYHGIVQRTNSHPFAYRNWLFQHNGEITDFELIKRELCLRIRPDLFPLIRGTTDSEVAFYLAVSRGLEDDPKGAIEAMIGEIEEVRVAAGIAGPLRFTCALTDGERIYALRYSSDQRSKSLYVNRGRSGMRELLGGAAPDRPAHIVLSEPLDDCSDHWEPIPESSFITVCDGELTIENFQP
ncbi:class II glutamine amidotransferase [Elongatibacter sediminis]|uniref:Class II glutamine amidotransferase n=1 Tax=Elongatibacter sediminis TaxID=3119006 RepID=A0AAW9R9Y1_9GAMM